MSEIYPALVPVQDAQGNLVPDASGAPQYVGASQRMLTIDLHTPYAILVSTNGFFNVPGWNPGPVAKLAIVLSRYIGLGTFGYKHFPFPVHPGWFEETTVVAPAIVGTGPIIGSRAATVRFLKYDRPVFATTCEPGSMIGRPGGIIAPQICPSLAQQEAAWAANPWNSSTLYDQWVAAGSPETVLADFHESSESGMQQFIDKATNLPGQVVTKVVAEVARVTQRVVAEVERVPSNVVDYLQNPRDFFTAVASDMQDGWGAPLLLFLGPGATAILVAMQAGADAHNLHDFAAIFSRQLAGGAAIALAGNVVGITGFFQPEGGYSNFTPVSDPVVNSIIVPNGAVKDAAKVAAYIDGIIPFFPVLIEDLAILAQRTSQERMALESKLAALKSQILKNSPGWYVAAKYTVSLLESIATTVATAGLALPMILAEALLTASTTVLQMVTAHQTLIDVRHEQERQAAVDEAAAQAELDALQRQIDAINAQIAAAQAGRNTSSTSTTSTPSTPSAPTDYGKLILVGAAALGGAYLLSKKRRS